MMDDAALVKSFWEECRALERDGELDPNDVIAFARQYPQSTIRMMLDEWQPDDATSPHLLSAARRL